LKVLNAVSESGVAKTSWRKGTLSTDFCNG
jgi:hypothetical protein